MCVGLISVTFFFIVNTMWPRADTVKITIVSVSLCADFSGDTGTVATKTSINDCGRVNSFIFADIKTGP